MYSMKVQLKRHPPDIPLFYMRKNKGRAIRNHGRVGGGRGVTIPIKKNSRKGKFLEKNPTSSWPPKKFLQAKWTPGHQKQLQVASNAIKEITNHDYLRKRELFKSWFKYIYSARTTTTIGLTHNDIVVNVSTIKKTLQNTELTKFTVFLVIL